MILWAFARLLGENGVVFLGKVRWISFPLSGVGVVLCEYEKWELLYKNNYIAKLILLGKRITS